MKQGREVIEYASGDTPKPAGIHVAGNLVASSLLCLYMIGMHVAMTCIDPIGGPSLLLFIGFLASPIVSFGVVISSISAWRQGKLRTGEAVAIALSLALYTLLAVWVFYRKNDHPSHYYG